MRLFVWQQKIAGLRSCEAIIIIIIIQLRHVYINRLLCTSISMVFLIKVVSDRVLLIVSLYILLFVYLLIVVTFLVDLVTHTVIMLRFLQPTELYHISVMNMCNQY